MFEALSVEDKRRLLKDFIKKPSYLSSEDIKELLRYFPFETPDLNYMCLQVFRTRKDLVPLEEFSRKVRTNVRVAEEILNAKERYAIFPVASEKEAKLVRALLVPIEEEEVIFVEGDPPESLKIVSKLAGKGFLVAFDSDFDWNKSSSYMLSLYASLVFGNRFRDMAFTGVITPEGKLEQVNFLDRKKEICRKENIPLVYPSKCLKDLKDLEKFITSLSVPLAVLPGTDPLPFFRIFPFKEEYLREVFYFSRPLVYTDTFEETVESFEKFAEWIKAVASELKAINEKHIPLKISVTGNVLVMVFYAGVVLSKTRLAIDFYQYDSGKYRKAFSISSDRHVPDTERVWDMVEIHETMNFSDIYIRLKTDIEKRDNALEVKLQKGKELDKNTLNIAYFVSKKIKSTCMHCKRLFLETSAPFAFALGYYLEDYICLELMHKCKPVYTIAPPWKGNIYLTNAFSLNMLDNERAIVNIKEIDMEDALKLLKKGYVSYISHPSTAQVLENMLNMKVDVRREPLKLKSGDTVVVFQIKKRPSEGQIFIREEVKNIVEEGIFSFYLVEVFY